MREKIFIEIIKQALPESTGYIGDDTAYVAEKDLLLTQDTLLEDVHFRLNTIPTYYLGRKSIAVNLSDIAAAGGFPDYVLISLSMPKHIEESFVREFYRGVHSICKEHGVLVVGGDLTSAEKINISICAIGSGRGLTPANRRNARPGDVVVVTGNHGSSRAGLHFLEINKTAESVKEKFIQAHINPAPRLYEGRKILEVSGSPAMMDTSDGLADALYQICVLSGVAMDVDFDKIPYDKYIYNVAADENTVRNWVLFGGEDYELVATMSEEVYEKLSQEIFIKKIGMVKSSIEEPFACVRFEDGEVLKLDAGCFEKNSSWFKHFG